MTIPEHYILKVLTLDQQPEIEISKEDFQELKSAKQTLLKALACEEKYEMVIHNYLVLEKEFSGIARLIEPRVTEARRCVEEAINKYKAANAENNSVIALYAISCNGVNSEIEKFSLPVLLDRDDTRLYLKKRSIYEKTTEEGLHKFCNFA